MIFDALTTFSGAVTATGLFGQAVNGAGFFTSTNTVDMAGSGGINGGLFPTDAGAGEPIDISISVLSAPTVGTNVQFQLIQADDAALTVNVQVLSQSDAFPIASLPIGAVVYLHADQAAPYVAKRYIGLRYINTGAIATASYFGSMTKNAQSPRAAGLVKSGFGIA